MTSCTTQSKEKNTIIRELSNEINRSALEQAFQLHTDLGGHSERMVIVDFSKPSEEYRFFVVNIHNATIEHKTLVSHAVNSGFRKAFTFSNTPNSYKSSVGRFSTGELYTGKNGLSLRIDGLDKGKNSNARKRAIVIHGSDYAEKDFYNQYGMLGRSKGCFAIPLSEHKAILPKIDKKTPMFVYQ